MIRYCTSVAVIAFLFLIGPSSATVRKISVCPNFNPNRNGFGGVECGDTIKNKKVVLTDDLTCDKSGETITLKGKDALLDCQGHTVRGIGPKRHGNDAIVILEDGASVINCNFLTGHTAVQTIGSGCFTINNVSSKYVTRDGIQIFNTGHVVMNDIYTSGSNKDGIHVLKIGSSKLTVEINNFESRGDHSEGLSFNKAKGTTRGKLYGNISMESMEVNGLQVLCGNQVEIYGNLEAIGSARMYGIDVASECRRDELEALVTFKNGSTGRICYNYETDVVDAVVEKGARVACDESDNDDICTESCNDWDDTKTYACVN